MGRPVVNVTASSRASAPRYINTLPQTNLALFLDCQTLFSCKRFDSLSPTCHNNSPSTQTETKMRTRSGAGIDIPSMSSTAVVERPVRQSKGGKRQRDADKKLEPEDGGNIPSSTPAAVPPAMPDPSIHRQETPYQRAKRLAKRAKYGRSPTPEPQQGDAQKLFIEACSPFRYILFTY